MRLKGTKLGMVLAAALGIGAGLGGIGSAQATFMPEGPLDGNPGAKLFLVASTGSPSFSGDVGTQSSGLIINGLADVDVDVANGFSTIKPSTAPTIGSITLTPVDPLLWGDLTFRGLTTGGSTVTVTVNTAQGETFSFDFTVPHNGDFKRIGAESVDGESILNFTLSDPDGFKQVKQITLSPCVPSTVTGCHGMVIPTPEPASLVLFGSGLVALGAARRRRA